MLRKGFSLLEVLLSFALLSLILMFTLNFFTYQINFCSNQSVKVDESLNVRIAIEFLSDKIRNSNSISFTNNILYVDNKKIYLNKDVLMYEYNSTPIINRIQSFNVKDIGNGLFEISVSSKTYSNYVVVKNRW